MECKLKHKKTVDNLKEELNASPISPKISTVEEYKEHNNVLRNEIERMKLIAAKWDNIIYRHIGSRPSVITSYTKDVSTFPETTLPVKDIDIQFNTDVLLELDELRKELGIYDTKETLDSFHSLDRPQQLVEEELSKPETLKVSFEGLKEWTQPQQSNEDPELANSVYEALGFKTKTSENEITRGIKEILPFKGLGDYSNIEEGLTSRRQYSTVIDGNNYVFDISTYSYENEDGTFQSYYDIDFTVNGSEDIIGTGFFDKSEKAKRIIQAIISQNYGNDTIRLNVEESKKGKQRLLLYKRLMSQLGYNPSEEMEYALFYDIKTDKVSLTPQQKQQALQLYSQYLDATQNQFISSNDKVVFGHPTIGKSFLKKRGEDKFITLDDDYANEVNSFVDANRGSETRQEYKGRKPKEYNEFMLNLYDRLKVQAQREGKILFVSNTNILKERMSDFDKVITIPKTEFKRRFDERGATYGFEDWKSDIDATIAKVPTNKIITTTGYLADLFRGSKQDIEGFKNWVNGRNNQIQYQLESELINPAIEELDNYLLDFLKGFNVKTKQFEELKSRLGVNALGATDVLNKLIWYVKNRNEETLPEESAHMLVALMGENHPDIKELLTNITNWSEYSNIKKEYLPIYKDENKVKIEAVGKLIAKSLVKNYKANGLDKNKLQKALQNILDFIENILDSLNFSNIFFYNENVADHIAINVLSGNKDYIYKIKNTNPNLNALKEIENNPNAKQIINTFSSNNVKMTGSLAIAGTENIRRPEGQGIHDIDFKVKSFEVFNKEVLPKIPENAVPAHYGWHKKTYSTFAYFIPSEGHRIEVIERKDDFSNGWITKYKLYNENGKQVEITQQNIISVDFFVYKEESSKKDFDFSSEFIPASLVYEGKMSLGGKSNPYFFSRDKDQEDYVLRNPKSFVPFEKHIYYQLLNESSNFISQKSQENNSFQQFQQSLNKPNTNPILQDNQQEQVKKFAELQERLNNKEFLEGAKNAYESTPALQQLGTQEEYNDYIARVSLGIIKNPSSGEYNYESQVKDIVYHGTYFSDALSKEDLSKRNRYFTDSIEYAKGIARKVLSPYILNKHPRLKYRLSNIKVIPSILNITNPQQHKAISQIMDIDKSKDGVIGKELEDFSNKIDNVDVSLTNTYVVFEPEQIHILGSKADIQGFKEFVSNSIDVNNVRLDDLSLPSIDISC